LERDMQQVAIERINNGENLFLTGSSGRGKSYVIDCITDSRTIKCAPTGTAALNIEGITAHSLFGLPITLPTKEDHYTTSKKMRKLIEDGGVNRIVIDEVGCLRADMLDVIDKKLKTLKRSKLPFGGIQMVLTGDFYQIEPIVHFTEEDIYYDRYDSAFCFTSDSWDFPTIELIKSYRNIEKTQISVLESIRTKDKWHKKAVDWVNKNAKPYDDNEDKLHLCCYNRDANALNSIQYRVIKEKEFVYHSSIEGEYNLDKPVKESLRLKEGCRVLIKSNDSNGEYVNGDRGVVVALSPDFIRVRLDRGAREVIVTKSRWDQTSYKVTAKGLENTLVGTYIQYPISLGYATSIHSAQGSTLDDVALDTGENGCFAHGQFFVGISRIRDLRNMSLVSPINYDSVICDPLVSEFYKNIRS